MGLVKSASATSCMADAPSSKVIRALHKSNTGEKGRTNGWKFAWLAEFVVHVSTLTVQVISSLQRHTETL